MHTEIKSIADVAQTTTIRTAYGQPHIPSCLPKPMTLSRKSNTISKGAKTSFIDCNSHGDSALRKRQHYADGNSAIAAFERYLDLNQLTVDAVHDLVRLDESGRAFFQVMDRFALHLLTSDGARGARLARGTAMLYFGSVKNWFYGAHAGLKQKMERQVVKITGTMDRRFKSQAPVISKQAPACKRSDLQAMVRYLLSTAGSEDDYWGCALLVLMWHLFGRSSDMNSLSKQSFALHPGGCVSVRFGRQKTSLEQGLSLFPAMDMLICPIHTLAIAVAADIVPSERLFRQLPRGALVDDEEVDEDELPLLDLLQGPRQLYSTAERSLLRGTLRAFTHTSIDCSSKSQMSLAIATVTLRRT